MSTKFMIIRHGETAWNRGNIFRGKNDIPLNKNGKEQAKLAAQSLVDVKIHTAYTSPLSRAKETAEIVTASRGINLIVHEGFVDLDYGEWTGKEDSEVARLWPREHHAWTTKPHIARPPGGMSLQEVFKESFTAMEILAQKHEGETVAIFSHRVVTKLLIIGALTLGLERFSYIMQGNCCINEIDRFRTGYLIRTINDVAHIRNAGIDLVGADF